MILDSNFSFHLCKKFGVFVTITLIWLIIPGSSTLLPDTFKTCGIFLANFQPTSGEQGDVNYEIIKHVQLNQKKLRSLIIQNAVTKRQMHPTIFRSMKYDCFLYVHINFNWNLLTTIPSFENPLRRALYQNGLFLIVVNSNPFKLITRKSLESHLERQYRVFLVGMVHDMNPYYHHTTGRKFVFYRTYFFCIFCKRPLQRINPHKTNYFLIKLSSFKKIWIYAEHYYKIDEDYDLENHEFCEQENLLSLFTADFECEPSGLLNRLFVYASGYNFTMEPYLSGSFNYTVTPQMFYNAQYNRFGKFVTYSSPVLNRFRYPNIIYCFNSGRVTLAETSMWTKYIPLIIWGFVGLILLLLVILNARSRIKIIFKFQLQNLTQVTDSLFEIIGIIFRQSWSHKWKLLGIFHLLFSSFISLYENIVTVNVVVPLVPRPFLNTRELYNNNYTFVVQNSKFGRVKNWFYGEYNTTRLRKVELMYYEVWVEKYFLNHSDEMNYAIVGHLSKYSHYELITSVKGKTATCYQMYPSEKVFSPEPFYFLFRSAVASSLHRGVSRIQTAGFLNLIKKARGFRENLLAITYARPLVAHYETSSEYLKNHRVKENMITLGNIQPVLYAGIIIILSGAGFFFAEMSIFHLTSIKQKMTLLYGNGLQILCLLTNKLFYCCESLRISRAASNVDKY